MVLATANFNENLFGKRKVLNHYWLINTLFQINIAISWFLNLIRKRLILSILSFNTNAHLFLWLSNAKLAIAVAAPGVHLLTALGQHNGIVASAINSLYSYFLQHINQARSSHTLISLWVSPLLLEFIILISKCALEILPWVWLVFFRLIESNAQLAKLIGAHHIKIARHR